MRLVDVGDVPGAGLDPDGVDDAARGLRTDAGSVRDGGHDVAGAWAGLSASYQAPEAPQLLRVMDPVRADTDRLADELERVAAALARFAGELREIVARCVRLRAEVAEFRARVAAAPVGGAADVGSPQVLTRGTGFGEGSALGLDPVLATQNGLLSSRIAALAEELIEAERACAASVRAIDGWQEQVGGLLLDTARGAVSDRLPWGEPGGPESCVGQAIDQVMVGAWSSGSWATFAAAYPVLSRLGGGASPVDQHAAWSEMGRSLIGWGVSEGEGFVEDLVQDAGVGLEDVTTWAGETTTAVLGWSADQVDALWQAGEDAAGWTGNRVQDASDWITRAAGTVGMGTADAAVDVWEFSVDNWAAVADDWANFGEMTGVYWDATVGSLLEGRWPRTTEVVASGVLQVGAFLGATGTTLTGGMVEVSAFDDGEARVGDLTPVPEGGYGDNAAAAFVPPDDLESLALGVTAAYDVGTASGGDGFVRITTIESLPGVSPSAIDGPRVLVSIPGTQPWFEWDDPGNAHPADFTGNLVTAGGGRSTMTEAVIMALEKADLPPSAEVMLIGHSQGGMAAADLGSDPEVVQRFNITNLMTFGAPIDSAHIDPVVDVLEVQYTRDVVALLDMNDGLYLPNPNAWPSPPVSSGYEQTRDGHTTVNLPSPGGWGDAKPNHSHLKYAESLATYSGHESLAGFREKLRHEGFLTRPGAIASASDIQIMRKD